MQVKSVIRLSEKEQESIDTFYNLLNDIDCNDIARATIQNKVLNAYDFTLDEVISFIYDINKSFKEI